MLENTFLLLLSRSWRADGSAGFAEESRHGSNKAAQCRQRRNVDTQGGAGFDGGLTIVTWISGCGVVHQRASGSQELPRLGKQCGWGSLAGKAQLMRRGTYAVWKGGRWVVLRVTVPTWLLVFHRCYLQPSQYGTAGYYIGILVDHQCSTICSSRWPCDCACFRLTSRPPAGHLWSSWYR